MPERNPDVKTISLVGNGPVARSAASGIDAADLVVRINRGDFCGVAGRRTDILLMRHPFQIGPSIAKGDPMNKRAQRGAGEFLFLSAPRDVSDQRHVDWLSRGKPVRYLEPSSTSETVRKIGAFAAKPDLKPTTGSVAIHHLLEAHPQATITLYGFTHEGWKGHSWDAERAWIESLIETGRVKRAPLDGPLVRLPVLHRAKNQIIRALRHLRHLRF